MEEEKRRNRTYSAKKACAETKPRQGNAQCIEIISRGVREMEAIKEN